MGLMDGDIGDRKPFHEGPGPGVHLTDAEAYAAREAAKRERWRSASLWERVMSVIVLPLAVAFGAACWVVPVLALYLLWLYLGGCAEPWAWKATGLCS